MDLPKEWQWLEADSLKSTLSFRWALSLIDAATEPLKRDVVDRLIVWPASIRSLDDYFGMWEFDPVMILPQLAGTMLLGSLSCDLYSSSQAPFWEWLGDQQFLALASLAIKSYDEELPTAVLQSSWFQDISQISLQQLRVEEWTRAIAKVRSTPLRSLRIEAWDSNLTSQDDSLIHAASQLSNDVNVEIQISENSDLGCFRHLPQLGNVNYSIRAHGLNSIAGLAELCPAELRGIILEECTVDIHSLRRLCDTDRFPQLTSLVIDEGTLDLGGGSANIGDSKSPCELISITCSGDFDFTALIEPSRLPNLEVLNLSHSNGDSSTIARILQLPNKEKLRQLAISSSFDHPFSVSALFDTSWDNLQVFKAYKQAVDHGFIVGMLESFRSGSLRSLELKNCDELAPGVMSRFSDSPAMANIQSMFLPFSWPTFDDAIHFCRSELASQLHSLLLFDTPPGTREEYLRALIDESRLSQLLEWTVPYLGKWDAGLARATAESPLVRQLDMIRADSHRNQFKEAILNTGQIRKVLQAIIERW